MPQSFQLRRDSILAELREFCTRMNCEHVFEEYAEGDLFPDSAGIGAEGHYTESLSAAELDFELKIIVGEEKVKALQEISGNGELRQRIYFCIALLIRAECESRCGSRVDRKLLDKSSEVVETFKTEYRAIIFGDALACRGTDIRALTLDDARITKMGLMLEQGYDGIQPPTITSIVDWLEDQPLDSFISGTLVVLDGLVDPPSNDRFNPENVDAWVRRYIQREPEARSILMSAAISRAQNESGEK